MDYLEGLVPCISDLRRYATRGGDAAARRQVAHGSLQLLAFAKEPGGDGANGGFVAIAAARIRRRIIVRVLSRPTLERDDVDP
jgi:hypothetical protein